MDFQEFIYHWWSEKELPLCEGLREKISTSYTVPPSFWTALFTTSELPAKSIPFEAYNFYHDCITRYCNGSGIALKSIDEQGHLTTWTYKQVDTLVSNLLPSLQEMGEKIALYLPRGIHFIVGLMATLRLGRKIAVVPPDDPYFGEGMQKALLDQISPDGILTLSAFHHRIKDKKTLLLDVEPKREFNDVPSYSYQSGEIVQLFPTGDIDANTSYLCPLRDGRLTLKLKQGTTWARPLTSMVDDEPAATLTALLAGATIVLSARPESLTEEAIEILGVSPVLQKAWTIRPSPVINKLRLWYKNPLYGTPFDLPVFIALNKLEKIPALDLLFSPNNGGIILCSKPHDPQRLLHPNFGIPWKLLQLNGSEEEALDGVGLFHIYPKTKKKIVLSKIQDAFWISRSVEPLKEGCPYPVTELEVAVERLPFVNACVIATQNNPQDMHGSLFILLVFVSPKKDSEPWNLILAECIERHIGKAFVPDKIFIFPFYPKKKEGKADKQWVLSQFYNGALFHKLKHPIYHLINYFKHSIYEKYAKFN